MLFMIVRRLRESDSWFQSAQRRKPGMIPAAKNAVLGAKFVQRQINFSQTRKPTCSGTTPMISREAPSIMIC